VPSITVSDRGYFLRISFTSFNIPVKLRPGFTFILFRFNTSRISPQRPEHESVYRNESSLRSSKFSSSETAPQIIFRYLFCAQSQLAIPSGKAQHFHGYASAILARFDPLLRIALKRRRLQDVVEIQMNSTRRWKTSRSLQLKVEGSLESLRTMRRIVL
jgi:hypothetical protein